MSKKETGIQFVKFSCVGFINTGVHYLVFYLLYAVLGVYYLASSGIGYCCGIVNSYVMNKTWTFESKDERVCRELSRFFAVNAGSLLVNIGSMRYLVEYGGIVPEVSQIVAIVFSVIINFLGNKLWTFKPSVLQVR